MSENAQPGTRQVDLVHWWQNLAPFHGRAMLVLALVLVDTALASLGVGMVLPVFQTLLNPEDQKAIIYQVFPFVRDLHPNTRIAMLATATVLLFGLKAAMAMLTTVVSTDFLQKLRFYWVARIGENYLYGPLRRLAERKQGELLNDWFNETLAATRFYQSYLTYFSSSVLVLALVILGMLVKWEATLALLLLGAVIVALARGYLFGNSTHLSKIKLGLHQSVITSMVEDLAHARDLKLLRIEGQRLSQVQKLGTELKAVLLRSAVLADVPRAAGEFLAVLTLMSFVVVGVLVMGTSVSEILPVLAFFFIAFYRLISAGSVALTARVKALNEWHSVQLVARLVKPGEREELESGLPLTSLDTDIRLCNLSFSYDASRTVLEDVSAVIPKGKTCYLVGPSGAGKSTLLDLLMRLEWPSQGHIELNGSTATSYRLSDWRRIFGYVSQEAALFNGDIKMNLRLARQDASDEDMYQACRLAGAEEFISALPFGYDTLVGDRGHSLSGGQRKRIAIARALLARPSVLILDEATTSFEQSLERDLRTGLQTAIPDLTVIVVTHRLQSVTDEDWVIALQGGRVTACGRWCDVQASTNGLTGETAG